jgi:hypothetical protein
MQQIQEIIVFGDEVVTDPAPYWGRWVSDSGRQTSVTLTGISHVFLSFARQMLQCYVRFDVLTTLFLVTLHNSRLFSLKLRSIECDTIVTFIYPYIFRSFSIIFRGLFFSISIQARDYYLYIIVVYIVLHTRYECNSYTIIYFYFIWFVRLLALRPLLAYCASLG